MKKLLAYKGITREVIDKWMNWVNSFVDDEGCKVSWKDYEAKSEQVNWDDENCILTLAMYDGDEGGSVIVVAFLQPNGIIDGIIQHYEGNVDVVYNRNETNT